MPPSRRQLNPSQGVESGGQACLALKSAATLKVVTSQSQTTIRNEKSRPRLKEKSLRKSEEARPLRDLMWITYLPRVSHLRTITLTQISVGPPSLK